MGDLDEHCSDVEDNNATKKQVMCKFKFYLQDHFVLCKKVKMEEKLCYRSIAVICNSTFVRVDH